MSEPIREQIIARLIKLTGARYGVPGGIDDDELPVKILEDGSETAEADAFDQWVIELPITIAYVEAFESSDPDKMRKAAHKALTQIVRDVYVDEDLGGLAEYVEYTGGSIQTEAARFVFAQAGFVVKYHTARGDLTSN